MGDRYYLNLRCDWCGEYNETMYGESCNAVEFRCDKCLKWNNIVMDFNTTRKTIRKTTRKKSKQK